MTFATQKGFTIFEVLIALAVSAMLALGCWQLLDSVTANQQQIEEYSAEIVQMDRAFNVLSADLLSMVQQKPSRPDVFNIEAAIELDPNEAFKFTRGGVLASQRLASLSAVNGDDAPVYSQMRRVHYELFAADSEKCLALANPLAEEDNAEHCLVRTVWRYVDHEQFDYGKSVALMAKINSMSIQLHVVADAQVSSQATWPLKNQSQSQQSNDNAAATLNPEIVAVEITFEHQLFGTITRLFATTQGDVQW